MITITDQISNKSNHQNNKINVLQFNDVLQQELEKQKTDGIRVKGIVHDLNNILMGMIMNIELAQRSRSSEHNLSQILNRLENMVFHVKRLLDHLKAISNETDRYQRIQIKNLLEEIAAFTLCDDDIEFELHFTENLWDVEMNATEFIEVINNFLINAQEAMPAGGMIYLSSKNIDLDDENPLFNGRYVCITIKDEGVGISADALPRIFEPNFTTKQTGNGLGLANSYHIINNNRGYVDVISEEGVGTTFFIYLPAWND